MVGTRREERKYGFFALSFSAVGEKLGKVLDGLGDPSRREGSFRNIIIMIKYAGKDMTATTFN